MELKRIPCDQKLSIAQEYSNNTHDPYQGKQIRASFHGWVILSNHPDNILWSLWNPLTSNLIRLPPLKKEKHSYECCLSSPPDDPCSVFLLLSDRVPTIVFCRLDRKRKRLKWTEMSYAKQIRSISGKDDCFLRCPTCCNGKVYAMAMHTYYKHVIHVEINNVAKGKEQVVIRLLPFVQGPDLFPYRYPSYITSYHIRPFLKGTCTDLFYIGVCFNDETRVIDDVYLLKLDTTGMMWEEVVELKDAIFFVQLASHDYSSVCYYGSASAAEVGWGGYVHILGEGDKIIYSFCAKDRTMAMAISSTSGIVLKRRLASPWSLEVAQPLESKQEEEDKDTKIVVDSESHLLNIPIDILEIIMELCVGKEYTRFRATCKHCYLAAPPFQWSSKATLRRLQLISPLLMVLDNYQGMITFIDPTRDDRYFVKVPQELKGDDYQIFCSRYGWLLMYKIGGPMVFFNPFTGTIRELDAPMRYLDSFCFSAPPTSPDCMVVGFKDYSTHCKLFFHLISRDSTWRCFRLGFGHDDGPYAYRFPVFKGRDAYALCNNKGIDVFKFKDMTEDDDYSWEVFVGKAPPITKSQARYFLSNCDQHHLLVVVGGEFGESVEVFKANNYIEEEWEKVDNLGKHVICISDTSCICFEAKSPEMENKIYFPRLLHNQGTKVVFYSLQTCRFHTFDDKQGFGVDLLTTKHHCYPHTWIQPS